MPKAFYITTTLPYINADPHIGFAAEIIRADVIARYQRLLGKDVFFNTGTDEHGLKIYRKAQEQGVDPQTYADRSAATFDSLKQALTLSYTSFIRTTDPHHIDAAQEFWKRCQDNGDIYKKTYKVKYCVGCELEKTESELVNNCCALHPNLELEIIEEENYFFRWSKYQQALLDLYHENPKFVVPSHRLKEIEHFVASGLEDFSISRLKAKMPWGIPVPDDPDHVMYVWFDALINYVSCLGWPKKTEDYEKYWPGMQVAGKDNLRQQSAMWQAMLLSAGLPTSKQILIFGFITSGGQKMSKSLGNVIDPFEVATKYSTDALRYYVLAELKAFEDSDFTYEKFEERYNADLANGLGNLVQRVAKMCEKNGVMYDDNQQSAILESVKSSLQDYSFNLALENVWAVIKSADQRINQVKPWELPREEAESELTQLVIRLREIAYNLHPFLPSTAEKITQIFSGKIKAPEQPLFPRIAK